MGEAGLCGENKEGVWDKIGIRHKAIDIFSILNTLGTLGTLGT